MDDSGYRHSTLQREIERVERQLRQRIEYLEQRLNSRWDLATQLFMWLPGILIFIALLVAVAAKHH